jgi:aldehyde:ferredoxin oxidoreductase
MSRSTSYIGTVLRVDLSSGSIRREPLPDSLRRAFIGGAGFTSRWLFFELEPGTDPLGEANRVMIATGPLTGTLWPSSGRLHMAARSPLSETWGESNCGGFFGPELKFAGYDALILEGKADAPVLLDIQDERVELRDARDLWGRDTRFTIERLKEDDEEAQVLCIGPAGETGVRYASVMSNLYRAFGRSGMGTVWGSKNLKAVRARGTGRIDVARPDEFFEVSKEAHRRVRENPQARQMFKYGTNLLVSYKQAIGEFVTRNHREGIFEGADQLAAEVLKERHHGRSRSCFGCTNACKMVYRSTRESPYEPDHLYEGPEYEGVMAFGSNCGIDDFDLILHVADLCNRYGMDQISAGVAISFLMECHENGLIAQDLLDGLDPRFGDPASVLELVHRIGRREGIGEILGEGVKRASEHLGEETAPFAMHVKGQEISGQDGRAHRSAGLTHAVGVRGADHLRSLVTVDQLGYEEAARERYGEDRLPEICDPYSETHKAYAVKVTEDVFNVRDALIVCWYTCGWPPIFWLEDFARALPLATGEDAFSDPGELLRIGERIQNVKRAFNLREGFGRKDDALPRRFLEEPMPSGSAKGQTVDLDRMLDEYYALRGWDKETGLIRKETLERLDLGDVKAELERRGNLS